MKHLLSCSVTTLALLLTSPAIAANDDLRAVKGLSTPESAVVASDGRIYVTEIGEFGKPGDGRVTVVDDQGEARAFALGLDDPKGIASFGADLFVADVTRVVRIDATGKVTVLAAPDAFPAPPLFLNDVAIDRDGTVYVSDSGEVGKAGKGAVYRISPQGGVSLIVSEAQNAAIRSPNGLLLDGRGGLLVADFSTGELLRVDLASQAVERLGDGFGAGDGLALDAEGRLYISDWKGGRVWQWELGKIGAGPQRYDRTFGAAADITLTADGRHILVPDMKAGVLYWLPR